MMEGKRVIDADGDDGQKAVSGKEEDDYHKSGSGNTDTIIEMHDGDV